MIEFQLLTFDVYREPHHVYVNTVRLVTSDTAFMVLARLLRDGVNRSFGAMETDEGYTLLSAVPVTLGELALALDQGCPLVADDDDTQGYLEQVIALDRDAVRRVKLFRKDGLKIGKKP